MSFQLNDKVITTKLIADAAGTIRIIDKDTKGVVVSLGGEYYVRQAYLVEFEDTIYKDLGNRWWVYEDEIKKY